MNTRFQNSRNRSPSSSGLPGGPPFTLAFVVAGQLDRAENYDTLELALFRAEEVKVTLLGEGWREE